MGRKTVVIQSSELCNTILTSEPPIFPFGPELPLDGLDLDFSPIDRFITNMCSSERYKNTAKDNVFSILMAVAEKTTSVQNQW